MIYGTTSMGSLVGCLPSVMSFTTLMCVCFSSPNHHLGGMGGLVIRVEWAKGWLYNLFKHSRFVCINGTPSTSLCFPEFMMDFSMFVNG